MSGERIYVYKRYERFWHWSQALLIVVMMISGFEVHGSYTLLGYRTAVNVHTFAAWSLLTIWAFTIVWQFTTGEWRQYLPTLKKVDLMVRYYAFGIFKDAEHPFKKSAAQKHNPLQRLAYLGFGVPAMLALWCWANFPAEAGAGYAFTVRGSTGLEGFGISLALGLNGISLPLFVMAGLVGLAAGLYAIRSTAERLKLYLMLLLFMQAGLMGVFASTDVFFLYFFHELALIPTFLMVGILA